VNITAQLAAEWRANPRLQLGIVVIAAIVALYGLLVWRDALDARESALQRLQRDVQKLAAVDGGERSWRQQADAARALNDSLQTRLWRAPTLAEVQAQVQDWAGDQLARAGAPRPSVAIAGDLSGPARAVADDVTPVRVALSFDFSPAALDALLPALESDARLTRITALRAGRGQQRVEITLIAYGRIEAVAVAPAAPTPPEGKR
jgi:hypothetical protein